MAPKMTAEELVAALEELPGAACPKHDGRAPHTVAVGGSTCTDCLAQLTRADNPWGFEALE